MQRKWIVVVVLFFVGAHNFADRAAVSAIFPILRHELGLTDVVLAGVGTAFLWSYAAGSPFAGMLADIMPRSRQVLVGVVAWSLIMMCTGMVHTGAQLIVMRVLLGLAECLYVPAAFGLLAEHHGADTRATAIGIQICGVNFGLIAGNTFAPYLSERMGWRMGFVVLGCVGLGLAVVCAVLLREGPLRKPKETRRAALIPTMISTLQAPGFALLTFAAMLIAVCTWSFLNWLPMYYHDHFHLNLTAAGFTSSSALQTASIVGSFLGGMLSDRLGRVSRLARMSLLAGSRFAAAPILLLFLWKLPLLGLSATMFAYNLMIGLGAGSETYTIGEVAGRGREATAQGVFNMASCVGGGVGVFTTVYLQHAFGWSVAFAGLAMVALAAGFALLGARAMMRRAHLRGGLQDVVPLRME